MGLGNFIICPFSIPQGWDMPINEALSRCDQVGARKAGIIYICISIFYGVVIGYASKHLIHRGCLSIQEYFAKRKRIYEQGRQSEVDRIAKEKVAAEKIRVRANLQDTEQKLAAIARQEKDLEVLEAAIAGSRAKSHRRERSSKSCDQRDPRMHPGSHGAYDQEDMPRHNNHSGPHMPYMQPNAQQPGPQGRGAVPFMVPPGMRGR